MGKQTDVIELENGIGVVRRADYEEVMRRAPFTPSKCAMIEGQLDVFDVAANATSDDLLRYMLAHHSRALYKTKTELMEKSDGP